MYTSANTWAWYGDIPSARARSLAAVAAVTSRIEQRQELTMAVSCFGAEASVADRGDGATSAWQTLTAYRATRRVCCIASRWACG